MSDVNYTPAKSIAELPITHAAHMPCPDMAGCADFDPAKTENSLSWAQRCLKRVRQLSRKPNRKPARIPARFREVAA